ncbi:hypothetical protein [Paenibacillus tuaregi]|uniref:hypothetical protein n=1 Tax=Paenibacillus tuaregi TaxID=1816681 RepID=UPI0008394F08|nr:hypothetical protein [Paenibacillus tuaregi]
MSKFKSELTRRYLLNSNSREVMDEVVKDHEDVEFGGDPEAVSDIRAIRGTDSDRNLVIGKNVEFADEADLTGRSGDELDLSKHGNESFLNEWDGKEETHAMYRRSYE